MRPVLQCHDEILCYCRNEVPPAEACGWLVSAMEQEMPEIPGLIIPAEPTFGTSWAESDQLKFIQKDSYWYVIPVSEEKAFNRAPDQFKKFRLDNAPDKYSWEEICQIDG